MIWFYEFEGEPKGPVSEDQLRNLLEAETITSETRLWKIGMPAWAPLSEAVPSLLTPPLFPNRVFLRPTSAFKLSPHD
ncbi:MAG: DUF4339 domain-containing protein [Pedosphaera sp.]|nr:DUF4339 domain-containing protein [Pedosphaera sp.]